MKTNFIITLLGFVMFTSCIAFKNTKTTTYSVSPQEEKPIMWKQIYFSAISLNDSVLFYNSSEIRLEGEFFKQFFFVKDGIVNVVDSVNNVSKIVPELTPGGLINLRKNSSGEIMTMVVSFSKNEATYEFSFLRKDDGVFTLSPKAKLFFKGKEYPVIAITSEECVLLFYYNKQVIKNEIQENAEGWK